MSLRPDNPIVSVIIPVYNRSDFLRQAIASVIAQTYRPIQLIVVDDGSTEPIEALVREFNTDPDLELLYIHQENAGVGAARNCGLKAAKGEYIAFLDSDDCWQPGMLESTVYELQACQEADIVVSGWNIINENGVQQVDFNDPVRLWGEKPQNLLRQLALGNLFPIHSAVARKNKIDKVHGFRTTLLAFEDWDLWIRLSVNGAQTCFIRNPGVSWRVYQGDRRSNLTLTAFESTLREVFHPILIDPKASSLKKEYGEHIFAWQILARIKNTKVFTQEDPAMWVKRSEELYLTAPKNPEIGRKYLDILAELGFAKTYFQTVQRDLPRSLKQDWWTKWYNKSWRNSRKNKNWFWFCIYSVCILFNKIKRSFPIQ